ncbi:tRNA (adenine(22)-N(1))-methyltransferase [Clostridium akagii]|uniref:tRNA (adenine(22)-N(1))-methyltransferase n=1 Tax=Clostridium akagii TaxID=91623 RepID=UPI00047BD4B5|nr:class I SAM-dependent methyltransferase [Clostridium akagii]
MEISSRLECIAKMIEKCDSIADIGTDHGYVPIYLIEKGICKHAIASDINMGPVEKARANIKHENAEKSIECRLGPGFSTVKPREVNVAIIAGMGGNLIRDIIEEGIQVFKSLDYVVLQPVQNPDVLRKYIYESGYIVLDEDLCKDENKYYEVIKIKYNNEPKVLSDVYYEVSKILLEKKHPLVKEYVCLKIKKYDKIFNNINDSGEGAQSRKNNLKKMVMKLEGMLECL